MLMNAARRARRRSGFTLMEVLVVVAILVILATIAAVAVPKQLNEAKKGTAVTQCTTIAKAVEQYMISAANPGVSDEERMPNQLMDLVNPQWNDGSRPTSFLPDGRNSLIDPWGREYQTRNANRDDGTPYIIIWTQAPDGTYISQHGVGAKSRVNQQ
jgi:general secretion pathway protein G